MAYLRVSIGTWSNDLTSDVGQDVFRTIEEEGLTVFHEQPGFIRYRLMHVDAHPTGAGAEWESEGGRARRGGSAVVTAAFHRRDSRVHTHNLTTRIRILGPRALGRAQQEPAPAEAASSGRRYLFRQGGSGRPRGIASTIAPTGSMSTITAVGSGHDRAEASTPIIEIG